MPSNDEFIYSYVNDLKSAIVEALQRHTTILAEEDLKRLHELAYTPISPPNKKEG